MWFERFVIVVTSLHRDYLPSSWWMFYPTWVDVASARGRFRPVRDPVLALHPVRADGRLERGEGVSCPQADPHHPRRAGPTELEPDRGPHRSADVTATDLLHGALATVRRAGRTAGGGQEDPRGRLPPVRHVLAFPDPRHGQGHGTAPIEGAVVHAGWGARSVWRSPSRSSGSRASSAYPLITGGKPLNSPEAFVPISFETMILYAAFGAVAGMLLLNGLPRLYHPVFRGRSFARATNDGFFLTGRGQRPKF